MSFSTVGKRLISVWGRKSADMYSSINRLDTESSILVIFCGNLLCLSSQVLGQKTEICAGDGSIAEEPVFFPRDIRQHSDDNRLVNVEVVPESACNVNGIEVLRGETHLFQEEGNARVNRRLCPYDILYIDLCQDDFPSAVAVKQILRSFKPFPYPLRGTLFSEPPLLVDNDRP